MTRDQIEAIQHLNEEFNKGFDHQKELITELFINHQSEQFYAWIFVIGKKRVTWKYYFKTGNIKKSIVR